MTAMSVLAPGTKLGHYVIQCPIGQGASGVVYRAHHQQWPTRLVAIKVPREDATAGVLVRAGIQQGRFDHPGIVRVIDVETSSVPAHLVLEWIEGESLAQRLARTGPLALGEAATVLERICAALDVVHASGIAHGDLKPSNILLGTDGRVVLSDFGGGPSASEIHRGVEWSLGSTPLPVAVGTLAYMAPEQRSGRAGDTAGDLYSLGVIWFEMLTARLPALSDRLVDPAASALYHALCAPAGQRAATTGELRARLATARAAAIAAPAPAKKGAAAVAPPVRGTHTSINASSAREQRRALWVFVAGFVALTVLALGTLGGTVALLHEQGWLEGWF